MISRYKWYEARIPGTIHDFLEKIERHAFTSKTANGFIVNEERLGFRYIWQATLSAQRLNEDGATERQEITTINSQEIAIVSGNKILFRMENPARSTRELMNALESIIGFGFSCQQIIIKDKDIQESLAKIDNKKLNSLKVSGALLESKALARIELASKEGLDTENIKILSMSEFIVDAASYEVTYRGVKGQIGFSKAGTCKISGQLTGFLLGQIEQVLMTNK